jgi:hypothetical protein
MVSPSGARPGRNEPCHCGSGRKYKHCCLDKDNAAAAKARTKASDAAASPAPAESAPPKRPKHQTHQPWKAAPTKAFVPRMRTPRKVGGS